MSKKLNKDASTADAIPGQGWSNGALPPSQSFLLAQTRDGRLEVYENHRRWIGIQSHAGWTRIGQGATELDARVSSSQSCRTDNNDTIDLTEEARSVRALIAQLCETFYKAGWATGTGGGVSIRVGGPSENRPWRIFVAPSGIQKEDMIGQDIFELDMDRNVVVPPVTPNLRQSACTPLWYVVYQHRPKARCVIHTHSQAAQLATLLDPTEQSGSLKITHLEMLKGVGHHAYDDMLEIPIIDNRPTEDLLAEQLERVIMQYPKCNAVLVRRHGVYVWGDSWEQAKTQCESFDYLFQTAIQMKQMGIDPGVVPASGTYRSLEGEDGSPPHKRSKVANGGSASSTYTEGWNAHSASANDADVARKTLPLLPRDAKILLLDVEGCTTSIAFVKEGLFPYVLERIEGYVESLEHDEKTKIDHDLGEEVNQAGGEQDPTITAMTSLNSRIVAKVRYLVSNDVKAAALKDLQGKMWKAGYESGLIQGHVYSDFPPMLQWMKKCDVKVYIYSSGSIQAQKLLFSHSTAGDLCPMLAGHFDIPTAGSKRVPDSYQNIAAQLGVEAWEIVFVSDAEGELVAAQQAGMTPVMSIRPGNATLTDVGKAFPALHSLLQLCGE